jgi:hypothetical protein
VSNFIGGAKTVLKKMVGKTTSYSRSEREVRRS